MNYMKLHDHYMLSMMLMVYHHRDHDVFLAVTVATAVAVTINAVPHSAASAAAMALPSVPATYHMMAPIIKFP